MVMIVSHDLEFVLTLAQTRKKIKYFLSEAWSSIHVI